MPPRNIQAICQNRAYTWQRVHDRNLALSSIGLARSRTSGFYNVTPQRAFVNNLTNGIPGSRRLAADPRLTRALRSTLNTGLAIRA